MTPDSEGLHEIANTRNAARQADIVFVHGLGGGSHSTWRYGQEGRPDHFFWPEELGKDLPDCGIWTLGHASGLSHWFSDEGMALEDLANNFALKLTNKGFGERPIIFITHSMGGLVVKELITAATALGGEDWARVVKAVRGIVFLGTPHHGSHMATVADGFAVLLRTQEHLKQMRFAAKALDQLHKRFMKWQAETKCPVEAYVETRGIARSGWFGLKRLLPSALVVPDISGDPNLPGCDCHRIGADHIELVKPNGREHDVYAGVLRFICDALTAPVNTNIDVASVLIPPQEFVDDRVRQAAIALNQARAEKSLTMRTLIGTLDRLFERATFRHEPSVGLCPTQEWDHRLHGALQTLRLLQDYEPFVEGEARDALQRYRDLTIEVSRYCERMAAYLFEPAVGLAELRGFVGTSEFINKVHPKKKRFEGGVGPETCRKIDPPLENAIRQMKGLHEEFCATAGSAGAVPVNQRQIADEEPPPCSNISGSSNRTTREAEPQSRDSSIQGRSRVYISYSYDSDEHIKRVREFAARLKADGIDARIDTDVNCDPPEGWPSYSQDQIQDADYVILICTETYRRRFDGREEPGRGKGVTFEGKLIRQEIFDSQGRTKKFIPVILDFEDDAHIPSLLRDRGRYVVSRDAESAAALGYESLLRRLRPSPSTAQFAPQWASPQTPGQNIMPTHQFNARRLKELEELLEIEYEKYHEFEKEIALSDGASKITLKQRFKRDVTPRLRSLEQEYAEMLVAGVPTAQIPDAEAAALVSELSEATGTILQTAPANAPQEMVRLLGEIKNKLSEPEEAASAKLKVSLPLIPTICSYEMEIETAGLMRRVWRKSRDFFKGLLTNRPK